MKEFFHASRDISFLKSFFRDGVKAIGKGVGGQKTGFYVYNNKENALEHIKFLNQKKMLGSDGGLIVGIKIEEKDLKYPEWQFDYERNPDILSLLEDYSPLVIENIKKIRGINGVRKTNRYGRFEIAMERDHQIIKRLASPIDPRTDFTAIWQKTFDQLCKNPLFKKEYDILLSRSQFSCKKYTGKKNLPISFLSYIHPTKDGQYKETILYTDEKPPEKQVCPFLKVYLAQTLSRQKKAGIER